MVDGIPVESLRNVCRAAGVTRAVIVGSAATGDGWDARRSDLDIYVDGPATLDLATLARNLAVVAGRVVDLCSAADPLTSGMVYRNWRLGECLL